MESVTLRSLKACEACQRVTIGKNFRRVSLFRSRFAFLLIYLSILAFIPLVFFGVLVYWHLKLIGAENVRSLSDFLPSPNSHRYDLRSQIVFDKSSFLLRSRLYWIFNCRYYCPFSVALLEWLSYLAKVVENWWCPFAHDKKVNYEGGSIDRSFWHLYPSEAIKLHPEDLTNPLWNDQTR